MDSKPVRMLPVFETGRLLLRQRTEADLEACLSMDRDPLVTQFIPGPWHDPIAHRAFVAERIRHTFPAGMGYWCIFDDAEFIGWVFVAPEDLNGPEIELGWRLTRSAWGRGFATEAARTVLKHAFLTLGLKRVIADIDPSNTASIGVARKLGFVPSKTVQHGDWTMTRHVAAKSA